MAKDLDIYPSYPFAKLLPLKDTYFIPKQLAHFFWYLASSCTIAIENQTNPIRTTLRGYMEKKEFHLVYQVEVEMLQWFHTLKEWDIILSSEWNKVKGTRPCVLTDILRFPGDNSIHLFDCWIILFLHISFNKVGNTVVSYTTNAKVYRSNEHLMLIVENLEYIKLQKTSFTHILPLKLLFFEVGSILKKKSHHD